MSDIVDDFLAHHGVKGMKWGVRREANRNFRDAQRQIDNAHAYSGRVITEEEYASFSAKPVRISPDYGEFKRVVSGVNSPFRSDFVYVTTDKNDNNTYKVFWNRNSSRGNDTGKRDLTIKVTQAVVSPGAKERVDALIKKLGEDVVDPESGQVAKGRTWLVGDNESPEIKLLTNRELGLRYYQQYAQHQYANTPLTQAIVSDYKKKGYNAIIDDADKGVLSNSSVILFPKETGAHITEVKPITRQDELEAKLHLKLPNLN